MYKLCLGSIFKLLCFLVNRGEHKKLYKALFLVEGDPSYLPSNNISEEKSGKRQINSDYVSNIKDIGVEKLIYEYRKTLPRFIPKNKRAPVILALKTIVKSDSTLDNVEIGKPKYKKENFLGSLTFDFYDLLGSFVYYCCYINSNKYEKYIEKIHEKMLLCDSDEEIAIKLKSDTITEVFTPISLTAVTDGFSNTFKEIKLSDNSLNTNAISSIKLFRLKIANNSFRTDSLQEFLENQVDHYILPRVRWKKLVYDRKIGQIAREAKKALNGMRTEEAFSQLMLYSFMECVLKAPKLFNAIDKLDYYGNTNKSAGAYFVPKGTIDSDTHNHLVYGSCKVEDDLYVGVENAVIQSNEIISNLSHERGSIERCLLDQATANTLFYDSEIDYLKKVIIPRENEDDEFAIDSIGIFVCYSTKALDDINKVALSEADKLLDSYLDNEIINCLPRLKELLDEYDLLNKDIFLFFLPLEQAIKDSKNVIAALKESI